MELPALSSALSWLFAERCGDPVYNIPELHTAKGSYDTGPAAFTRYSLRT